MRHEWKAKAMDPERVAQWAVEGDDTFTDYGLGGEPVRTAAGDPQMRAELLRLAEENQELQLTVAGRDATLAMTVARLGGEVEGAPTHRVNFLQRIDALRAIEEERDRLVAENHRLAEDVAAAKRAGWIEGTNAAFEEFQKVVDRTLAEEE